EERLRLGGFYHDVVVGERSLLLDLAQSRLDLTKLLRFLAQRAFKLCFPQRQHAADFGGSDLLVEHARDLLERKPEALEGKDAIELRELISKVVTVAG